MKVELLRNPQSPSLNRLSEFKIGSIGIVREWADTPSYIGHVLVRTSEQCVFVLENLIQGKHSYEYAWCRSFPDMCRKEGKYYIETLHPGTELKITL